MGRILGISTRAIRLYEELGLVAPPKRTEGRIRYYEKSDERRFKFVLKLKALGLSLEEMKELADLCRHERFPAQPAPRLLEVLDGHLAGIRDRVEKLKSLETDICDFRKQVGGDHGECTLVQRRKL
ncbi:helix-turn-helix domain-containing protein [Geomonas azotofigens]|uniref:helix-turn-helix domain-containing protein n=1 Tax=Geomonas azotofigens TaxID=2843196 RepID=UPI001F297711|nr:MerR family transcriptional regulator [Geomonas azotofigens]